MFHVFHRFRVEHGTRGQTYTYALETEIELNDFYNAGFGWICRPCERDLKTETDPEANHSRVFREGEAESRDPRLATIALAKWTDKTRRFLTCPRCGITEAVERS